MKRCAACPGKYNCIPPSGPTGVDTIFIGEAPGWQENKHSVPFTGRVGEELNSHYLPVAGLRRENCYFTNTIKCLPDTPEHKLDLKKPYTKQLIESCATTHLYEEIDEIGPKLLVPMGAIACNAIDPAINLELHHGTPFMTRLGIMAFPMWHPAGGMHNPKTMLHIRTDWDRLRRYMRGKLVIPKDRYLKPDYQECNGYGFIDEIDPTLPIACDTEWSKSLGPYCLTYSQCPGTGRLIKADRPDLLKAFQAKLDEWESIILFHNWLYDRKNVEDMGLSFPDRLIRDTMVRVFHLGNLPQGLKALALRELGMAMQDFDDLVVPYSRDRVLDYYREANALKWDKPPEELKRDDKTGFWRIYKPQSMNTKLKRFFTDLNKNEDKDPFAMFEDNWKEQQELIQAKCGPYPGKDIAHVPFHLILKYACRDADATLRLNPILEAMRRWVRHKPQEQWRAA